MCRDLKLEEISLGGPVFDVARLRWLNGRYIREDHDAADLLAAMEAWSLGRENLLRIVPLVQPRLETFADWPTLTSPFFADEIAFDPADFAIKKKEPDEVLEIVQMALWRLEGLAEFTAGPIKQLFEELAGKVDVKLRDLGQPFYVALSGSKSWTPLFDSMEVLGPDMVRVRLRRALAAAGGLSSKRMKAAERRYAGLFGGSPR